MRGPHLTDRRRRIARRFALGALAVGLTCGTGVAGAQEPPLLTTTTTEAPEETTTTTTEAPEETTTTEAPDEVTTTTTSRSTATTDDVPATVDDEDDADDVVVEDEDEDDVVVDGETDDTEPEPTSTTLRDLLVPGDGSDGAESTTTTSTTVAQAGDDGIDEETQVWLIVGGLVAVALLIGAWTVRYWRRTRPVRPDDPGPEPDATTVFGTP